MDGVITKDTACTTAKCTENTMAWQTLDMVTPADGNVHCGVS